MTPKELRELRFRGYAGHTASMQAAGLDFTKDKKHPPTHPLADTRATRIPLKITSSVCANLGPAHTNQKPCGCGEKLRVCEVHGTCTTGTPRPGVACCVGCGDFESSVDERDNYRRHLIYFLYPVANNDMWKWNLDQIIKRIDLFNGRRIIAVATPHPKRRRPKHGLVDPQAIIEYLGKTNFDVLRIPQIKRLGEVSAFPNLLTRLRPYTRPTDVFFYAHGKGVLSNARTAGASKGWADLMYKANLDHWHYTKLHLQCYPTVGAFKRIGGGFGTFHYSGTFFWCRNADVFSRNWQAIDKRYGGVELWPQKIFTEEEASCIFFQEPNILYAKSAIDEAYDLYSEWARVIDGMI